TPSPRRPVGSHLIESGRAPVAHRLQARSDWLPTAVVPYRVRSNRPGCGAVPSLNRGRRPDPRSRSSTVESRGDSGYSNREEVSREDDLRSSRLSTAGAIPGSSSLRRPFSAYTGVVGCPSEIRRTSHRLPTLSGRGSNQHRDRAILSKSAEL